MQKIWICESCNCSNSVNREFCWNCGSIRPRKSSEKEGDGHQEEIEMQLAEGLDPVE